MLDVPGVTDVILLEGINDIGWSSIPEGAAQVVAAEDIIAADKQLIARAHARGVKVYGATPPPFQGATYNHADGEAQRQAVNAFIRSCAFDGLIDFEAASRTGPAPGPEPIYRNRVKSCLRRLAVGRPAAGSSGRWFQSVARRSD